MKGVVTWFARNGVSSNLLFITVIAGGLITLPRIKREIFPEVASDMVTVSVLYPGASPEEVEEGICVPIEEEIDGLDGVGDVTSTAVEGVGSVAIELAAGTDTRRVLDDVKTRVDAIVTFPEEAEKPVVQEVVLRRQVIDVAVWGDADEATLKEFGQQVRDEIVTLPGVTHAALASTRPYEISIEVSEESLQRHGLTFDDVAGAVRRSSLDLPGGTIRTEGGEILLRTKGQAYRGRDFEEIVLLTRPDGTRLAVGDVARVVDGFAETHQSSRFNGSPSVLVQVHRVGDQDALKVAKTVRGYVENAQERMPEGIHLTTWLDQSVYLQSRLDMMIRNARAGFILVFIVLALFLRFRLAFWVCMGIPLSFLGAMWLMPGMDVSINLVSLFAFIVVLGIVVDDAIVVGENVYKYQQAGEGGVASAIKGTKEVSTPVIFGVLTTIAAFAPLLIVSGTMGRIWRVIPMIVIPTLLFSLLESQFVLPSHLSHFDPRKDGRRGGGIVGIWHRFQDGFNAGLMRFVERIYRPSLNLGLKWRYVTISLFLAAFILTAGMVGAGWVKWTFFPKIESDYAIADLRMAQGAPVESTEEAIRRLEKAALQVREEFAGGRGGGRSEAVKHVLSSVGEQPNRMVQDWEGGAGSLFSGSHLGEVNIELVLSEDRTVTTSEVVKRWRELAGRIPGVVDLTYNASLMHVGDAIDVQLSGRKVEDLQAVAEGLKEKLAEYPGVFDITDSHRSGKQEIKLHILPEAEAYGLTLSDVARQVRQAFYGEEAQRILRDQDEVKVMVRYPEERRRSLADLENMWIRTRAGVEIPFHRVARAELGAGYAVIQRTNRQRTVNVIADVDQSAGDANAIVADLKASVIPALLERHPRVSYTFEGEQREQAESLAELKRGFLLALLMIYVLMAIPFKSYIQPFIIMTSIPFGFVGSVLGHLLMGKDLSLLSVVGGVALTGVIVNDGIVLVDYINRMRRAGTPASEAIREAGVARFRAILLTSLTTFAGLTPILLEKSLQAQFLIPMAVSLAFGVLFGTFVTLILIPCGYQVLEDGAGLWRRVSRGERRAGSEAGDPVRL